MFEVDAGGDGEASSGEGDPSSGEELALATCCTLAVEVTVPYVAAGKREAAAVLDPIVAAKAFAPA